MPYGSLGGLCPAGGPAKLTAMAGLTSTCADRAACPVKLHLLSKVACSFNFDQHANSLANRQLNTHKPTINQASPGSARSKEMDGPC